VCLEARVKFKNNDFRTEADFASYCKQEQQIMEQRVKVKGLALQLNDIVDFLNNCGAQEEKITMQWQNR
jgi:hypothetical protein